MDWSDWKVVQCWVCTWGVLFLVPYAAVSGRRKTRPDSGKPSFR